MRASRTWCAAVVLQAAAALAAPAAKPAEAAASAVAADEPCDVVEPRAKALPPRRAASTPLPAASAASAPRAKRPRLVTRRFVPPCAAPVERAEPVDFTPVPELPPVITLAEAPANPFSAPPAAELPPALPEQPDCECFAPAGFPPAWSTGGRPGWIVWQPPAAASVTPIPEPGSWALLAAGLAALRLRRRKA